MGALAVPPVLLLVDVEAIARLLAVLVQAFHAHAIGGGHVVVMRGVRHADLRVVRRRRRGVGVTHLRSCRPGVWNRDPQRARVRVIDVRCCVRLICHHALDGRLAARTKTEGGEGERPRESAYSDL